MMTLDMDGRYKVKGWPGVAVWLDGWTQRWEPSTVLMEDEDGNEWEEPDPEGEGEYVDDDTVQAVMVGDDKRHTVDVSDLIPIADEDYCSGCGQIGCGWC